MPRPVRVPVASLVAALLLAGPVAAQVVIDFEQNDAGLTLSEGDDASVAFVGQGVTFYFVSGQTNPLIAVEGLPAAAYIYAQGGTNFYDVATSGVNTITDSTVNEELGASFAVPVTSASFVLHDYGDCVASVPMGDPVTINFNGFDAAGAVVATDTYTVNRYGGGSALDGHTTTLSISGSGIVSAETSGLALDCGWAADDFTFTPQNVPPVADAGGPYSGNEPATITLDGSGSTDADGTLVEYAWDCTDDGTFDVIGASATGSCSYADDGAFTARLRVTDDSGATDEATAAVTIANLDPVLQVATQPNEAAEGTPVAFSSQATDPGPLDVLTFTWSWGDGTADSVGANQSHAFPDDGTFQITIVVDDGDGGSDSATWSIVVTNVPPAFDSTPPTTAAEGQLLSYTATRADPAGTNDPPTYSLVSGPAGMTLDPATGLVEWTPTYAQALLGTATVELSVDDGDGGTGTQTFVLAVSFTDDDADGMADTWETSVGLDPGDATDAAGDPDGDNITNLDEFLGGTDPFSFDGPGAPSLLDPIGGAEVASVTPALLVQNAVDPGGDTLSLTFEVYADASLTTLVTTSSAVVQDVSGQTTWPVDVGLSENASYTWRARAADASVSGPWAPAESFVVNEINEAPTAPTPASPLDGELVGSLTPLLQWGLSSDPDGDSVTYTIEVWADDAMTSLLTDVSGLTDSGSMLEWTMDVALTEDAPVWIRCRATDEHGLEGPWSVVVSFRATTVDDAPMGVVVIAPGDGEEIATNTPLLVAGGGSDPEGADLLYEIAVDDDLSFADPQVRAGLVPVVDEASWDLTEEGEPLADDRWHHVRARASDGAVTSTWDVHSFFVNTTNDRPSVPVLVAPTDGAAGDGSPSLAAAWAQDQDEDELVYEFLLAGTAELGEQVAEWSGVAGGNALLDGAGEVSVDPQEVLGAGTYWWSARAVDEHGLASDWAVPWSLIVEGDGSGDDDDAGDDDDREVPECGCSASSQARPLPSLLLLIALTGLAGLRRRGPPAPRRAQRGPRSLQPALPEARLRTDGRRLR